MTCLVPTIIVRRGWPGPSHFWGRYSLDEATGQRTPSEAGARWGQLFGFWAAFWLSRQGRGDGWGLFGIDDVHELRLERSTTHEEAVHVGLACQLLAGRPCHRTSINDTGALSHCIRDVGLQPSPELLVNLLSLKTRSQMK